ncbi:MAG: glycosyltransferase family 4 protein, partial [Pseudomonadota bacterium]
IDVVQICNPPDFLFLPALLAKKFGGARIVFDQHDLTPALLAEKTGKAAGPLMSFARWAERRTFAAADAVIATNSALRDRALRFGMHEDDAVSIVYSSPDLDALQRAAPDPSLKKGADTLLLWVGVMGSQDGLDLLLQSVRALQSMPGGATSHVLIAGDGPERAAMEAMAVDLGVADKVTFAGFLHGEALATAFATADIGVGSDPKNPFNDRLAMNKVFEYMAWRLPMALFDLDECRNIAASAALYASNNDPASLAANISNLTQSPELRRTMGARGFSRLERDYGWEMQKERYVATFERLRHG